MNRLNKLGQEIIERKRDLLAFKSQERIFDALVFEIEEKLYKPALIDETTKNLIITGDFNESSLRNYLLTRSEYIKTQVELAQEFKNLRELLVEELKKQNLDYVSTDFDINNNSISVLRTYVLDEKYVLDNFDIDADKVKELMAVKGFVSKYSILRLPKILKDFISLNEEIIPHYFTLEASKVYDNKDPLGYCIDLKINIKTDEIEQKENIEHIVGYSKDIIQESDKYFEERTS